MIIKHFSNSYEEIPITYTHQREQKELAQVLLTVEDYIDDELLL